MICTLLRKPQTAPRQGALNLDACRVGGGERVNNPAGKVAVSMMFGSSSRLDAKPTYVLGRFPANVILTLPFDCSTYFKFVRL